MTVAARRRATREKVLAGAGPLFAERGYREATMADLARAGGVSVQTLYLSFGSKAAVLEAVVDAAGDGHPDGWPAALAAEPDGPTALARHVAASAAAIERRHRLDATLRAAAADPDGAALLATSRARQVDVHARAVDELAEKPGFTTELSLQRATDAVAALLSPETFERLVVEAGWTTPDWAEWARRHLTADLFPSRAADG